MSPGWSTFSTADRVGAPGSNEATTIADLGLGASGAVAASSAKGRGIPKNVTAFSRGTRSSTRPEAPRMGSVRPRKEGDGTAAVAPPLSLVTTTPPPRLPPSPTP